MAPSEFWGLTLRDLWNAGRGYQNRHQTSWYQVRWLGTVINNTSMGGKRKQPGEMLFFPWEDEQDRSSEIELIKERRKWLQQQ